MPGTHQKPAQHTWLRRFPLAIQILSVPRTGMRFLTNTVPISGSVCRCIRRWSAFDVGPVENLLAFLHNHALAGELIGGNGIADVPDFFAGDLYPALLDKAAGLSLGGHQAALEHELQNADGPVGKVGGGQARVGHSAADRIHLVYQHYRTALQQTPTSRQLLPIQPEDGAGENSADYIFEPSVGSVLRRAVELYVKSEVFSVLLEAKAGEQAARMTAMTAATDATDELIGQLSLELNRARQTAITTEIAEIVGGANALKHSGENA